MDGEVIYLSELLDVAVTLAEELKTVRSSQVQFQFMIDRKRFFDVI